MTDLDHLQLHRDIDAAKAGTHRQRAMRVTMECGHLRLMPFIDTVMGIGSMCGCQVCPDHPARTVVNVEETGVLHDSYAAPVKP